MLLIDVKSCVFKTYMLEPIRVLGGRLGFLLINVRRVKTRKTYHRELVRIWEGETRETMVAFV